MIRFSSRSTLARKKQRIVQGSTYSLNFWIFDVHSLWVLSSNGGAVTLAGTSKNYPRVIERLKK